jgi:hypothetical protein
VARVAALLFDHFAPYQISRVTVAVARRSHRLEPLELSEKIVPAAHIVMSSTVAAN